MMVETLTTIIGWAVALGMIAVTVMLTRNKAGGLNTTSIEPNMMPQVLLVRYASFTLLILLAAWFNAPWLLFAVLLTFALVGLGDDWIYRRAGIRFGFIFWSVLWSASAR